MNEHVAWGDVDPLARRVFNIWTDRGDYEWARTAWAILGEHGLAFRGDPNDSNEETRVRLRLLVLGALYHAFARRAWGEGDADIESWAQEDSYLSDIEDWGSLMPGMFGPPDEDGRMEVISETKFADWGENGLLAPMRLEHPSVLKALVAGWGGETEFFVALWQSRWPHFAGWRQLPDNLFNDTVGSNPTEPAKLEAFEWVAAGAQI